MLRHTDLSLALSCLQVPSYYPAHELGYTHPGPVRSAAPTASRTHQRGGARYVQSKKSGSRKRGCTKAQIEAHVQKRQKEWEDQDTSPRSRAKDMVTDCIDSIHEGAQMLSDEMEAATNTAENRLAVAYTTRSTQQSRDRMNLGARERPWQRSPRLSTHCASLLPQCSNTNPPPTRSQIRKCTVRACAHRTLFRSDSVRETVADLCAGKAAKQKAPKRLTEPASVGQALLNAAEIEWRKRSNLVSKHTTIAEACRAGFALTSEKGCHCFWGDVKRTAEASIGKNIHGDENPWAELDDDETPALPPNVLRSGEKETRNIARAIEAVTGGHAHRHSARSWH